MQHRQSLQYLTPTRLLIRANILPHPGKRLKYAWSHLVSDQPRKDHEILRLLQQLSSKHLAHRVFKLSGEEVLAVA